MKKKVYIKVELFSNVWGGGVCVSVCVCGEVWSTACWPTAICRSGKTTTIFIFMVTVLFAVARLCAFFLLLSNRIYPFLFKTWLQAHNHHTNMFHFALYSLIFGFGFFFFSFFLSFLLSVGIDWMWLGMCVKCEIISDARLSFSARQISIHSNSSRYTSA